MSYRLQETGAPKRIERQPGLMGRFDVTGWEARYVGNGIYDLIPGKVDDRCMTMTGNAVVLDAVVPINHRLVRYEWKHTDGAYADDATATAAILSRWDYDPSYVPTLLWRLYYETASTSSTTVVPFGTGYEYLATRYRVSFNTTNGHFVWPRLWIQEVKP